MQLPPYYIFFKVGDHIEKFNAIDIIHFEACGKYVNVITPHGKTLIRDSMKELEEGLMTYRFFRVHRSYIVNIHYVQKIYKDHVLLNDRCLPLGKEYACQLKNKLTLNN